MDALNYGLVFEDDGNTGYFYAITKNNGKIDLLDALHIYNVKDVVDKDKPCEAEFCWDENGLKAALLINGYCHAIFDIDKKGGYCRNAYPEANSKWTQVTERLLMEELVEAFFQKEE